MDLEQIWGRLFSNGRNLKVLDPEIPIMQYLSIKICLFDYFSKAVNAISMQAQPQILINHIIIHKDTIIRS